MLSPFKKGFFSTVDWFKSVHTCFTLGDALESSAGITIIMFRAWLCSQVAWGPKLVHHFTAVGPQGAIPVGFPIWKMGIAMKAIAFILIAKKAHGELQ